jgi:arylsulfatase A-like enzyme
MTGLYQQKVGIEGVVHATKYRHTGLDREAYTLAEFMKEKGYRTGIMGKWHLGYDTAFSPVNFGFDVFNGYVSGNVDYHSHLDGTGVYDWYAQKDLSRTEGYTTDLITEAAIGFIKKNKEYPFFLYVPHEAPHFPFQDRDDPPVRMEGVENPGHGDTSGIKVTYRNMIKAMDEGIGEMMRTLEALDLARHTLVLFLSDNGAMKVGSNDPLRGYKGSLWEGGHRVPAIAYWPGTIQPGVNNDLLMTMDIFPTLATLASDEPETTKALDGIDFSPVLLNQAYDPAERLVFWRFKDSKSVRQGPWKLLVEQDDVYLFNLDDDLSETKNLLDIKPTLADSLLIELDRWEHALDRYPIRTK